MVIANQQLGSVLNGTFTENVEKAIHALNIRFEAAAADGLTGTNFYTLTNNARITVQYTSKRSSNERIYNNVLIGDILEFSTLEGAAAVAAVNGSNQCTDFSFTIPIAVAGALNMENDDTLEITITGLLTAATFKLTIYGQEDIIADNKVMRWSSLSVGSSSNSNEKNFDMRGYSHIVLPVNAALTDIQLRGTNGKNITLTAGELRILAMKINEVALIKTGTVGTLSGGVNAYCLPVSLVEELVVTTNGTAYGFYAVAPFPVNPESGVVEKNAAIADTTTASVKQLNYQVEKAAA